MRAIVVRSASPPSEFRVSQFPEPTIGPGDVRIAVFAAGVNYSDALIARGEYQIKPEYPFVPGAEVAGEVIEVGSGVELLKSGDRVMAHTIFGGFAEQVVVPEARCFRIPDDMTYIQGAAFPIAYPTAYAALVDRARIRAKETVLIHAAAGGVGLAAVQIANTLGARVIASAGSPQKLEVARKAGAAVLINRRVDDTKDRVMEETGNNGVDVVIDVVGGQTTDTSIRSLAWKGRLVVVGFASGTIPHVQLNRVMLRNIALIGLHWGAYPERDPREYTKTVESALGMFGRGEVEPTIYSVHDLQEAGAAVNRLIRGDTFGKSVLRVSQ